MDIKITIDKPDWDPNPEKTNTNNWNWRKCVIVEFENQTFKWIPTYKQLAEIMLKLAECEQENRRLARENLNKNQENKTPGRRKNETECIHL